MQERTLYSQKKGKLVKYLNNKLQNIMQEIKFSTRLHLLYCGIEFSIVLLRLFPLFSLDLIWEFLNFLKSVVSPQL